MTSKNTSTKKYSIGVLGSGSFGTVLANLLAENNPVILYTRREEVKQAILQKKEHLGRSMHKRVTPTLDMEEVTGKCQLMFPTVPATSFRELIRQMAPHLRPEHMLIHATKGLDIKLPEGKSLKDLKVISRDIICTMSEVIREETAVLRIGCLAGPNLAAEIAQGQPAATVIASHFNEVIEEGRKALRSLKFQVYASHDLVGAELAGTLKNTIAIASGMLSGLGLGENARAYLITKGWGEMIRIGKSLGSDMKAFMGLAGIGDLIATCSSTHSRNYTVGYRLAKGEKLENILQSMSEVAEGVNTIRIVYLLAKYYKIRIPIIDTLYQILYKNLPVSKGLAFLMKYPYPLDVDFL